MKKLILLALVCTGFAVTTPFTAHALDPEKIAQYDRDRYPNDQNRDNQNREEQYRDSEGRRYQSGDSRSERLRQRLFVVYYRNHDDSRSERLRQRKWIYESKHYSRRAAQRAADRLERRGYRIQILG
jgi:hypothetical protein